MRSFSLILLAAAKVSVASPVNSEFQQYAKIADPSATSYEYIVVGSGAGGGPLAARLAMAGKRTLLIEAGDDQGENFRQAVPVLHAQSTEDPTMAWDFWVQHYQNPERQALDSKMTWDTPDGRTYVGLSPPRGSKMRGILYPRAATLGGCTAHNALVTVYPHDRDWELIENLTGDTTWSPKNMRRIFEKMEKNEYITGLTASRAGHGFTGWFHTNIFDLQQVGISGRLFDTKLLQILYGVARTTSKGGIFSSIADLASLLTADLNRETRTRDTDVGMWPIPIATAKGKRAGSRDFVLETYNAKTLTGTKRYPLDIALNTFVTKVTFANTTAGGKPKVTGVEYLQGKYLYKAAPNAKSTAKGTSGKFTAEKEVILSGGAYNSPQILKLSGIGPKAELQRHNIHVLVDLPGVGANLQDHMEIGVEHESATPFKITADCTWGKAGDPCMADWRLNRGIYPATNGFPVAVIKKSSVATRDRWFGANPDLFLFGGPTSFHGYYPGYSNDAYNSGNWSWVVLKAHTANGAGTVTLRSADPLDPPNIQFNFFDSGDAAAARNDVQAMVEGIELGRELTEASNDRELREKLPGRAAKTTAQLSDYVKAESWSHHASCTCPIGADNDALSVLDSKFRVRGTSGLRVVDASVFPRIPGFFVAVPTYMVGEKAAESILTGN